MAFGQVACITRQVSIFKVGDYKKQQNIHRKRYNHDNDLLYESQITFHYLWYDKKKRFIAWRTIWKDLHGRYLVIY